jgi:hypothetical protein
VSALGLGERVARNLSNVPGWSTRRRIVAIASDDWGAIRMPSPEARERLRARGVDVEGNRFDRFDALESNEDLELLFELLERHRDANGNPPVVTALCNVANPDFERIRASGFREYHWEPTAGTLERYPGRDRVLALYREGMAAGLFSPEFHGREHLHAGRWMRALRAGDPVSRATFDLGALGPEGCGAAFDLEDAAEVEEHRRIARGGLELFTRQFGRPARFFTAPSLIHSRELEEGLSDVPLIDVGKRHRYPVGGGAYRPTLRFMGQRSRVGQTYLTRNCIFEQNVPGVPDPVGRCLADMTAAFRWGKPAIISTHRVSVAGGISPANRGAGLSLLDVLLREMLARWPGVEFMSVARLGQLVVGGGRVRAPDPPTAKAPTGALAVGNPNKVSWESPPP